uniref:Uncharacterized protein n=1 Tax=viral metagenome TaxID=1070528 RepID=A0A6C0JY46_9ZZZZ
MSSQPDLHESSYDPSAYPASQDAYGMTEETKDLKREQFRTYLHSLIDNTIEQEDTIELVIPTTTNKHFFYFIGRLNPPHDGHIAALEALIHKANAAGSEPLILLGSGPGKLQTLDNPIPFSLKREFIESKLSEKEIGGMPIVPNMYHIEEMASPAGQVSAYVMGSLEDNINYDEITITHVAGGKDEDTTKLAFALNAARKTAESIQPGAQITASTFAVEAKPSASLSDQPMSATQVRKSVYNDYLEGKGFDEWNPQYKEFYGTMAHQIYDAILAPALGLKREQVLDYIKTGQLPKPSSESTGKKQRTSKKTGGNRKHRTHKNKKQSIYNKTVRRNKRRTLRKQ